MDDSSRACAVVRYAGGGLAGPGVRVRSQRALHGHLRRLTTHTHSSTRASRQAEGARYRVQTWSEHWLRYVHRGAEATRPDMCTVIWAVRRRMHTDSARAAGNTGGRACDSATRDQAALCADLGFDPTTDVRLAPHQPGCRQGPTSETPETTFSYAQLREVQRSMQLLTVLPAPESAFELGFWHPSTAVA